MLGKVSTGRLRSAGWFAAITLAAAALTAPVSAAPLMPNFADLPTGWTTDRYEPASFGNVGTYQGRDNVLGIDISSAEGAENRGSQSGTFYNTQGRKYLLNGGAGDTLSADLFVEEAWINESDSGSIRTDMWGTMTDGSNITAYPIIGFTNQGGAARFRVYEPTGWVDLGSNIAFGAWNTLSMLFNGQEFVYSVNGAVAHVSQAPSTTSNFSEVIMQAYNFYDPTLQAVTPVDYGVRWANTNAGTQIPAPATLFLLAFGLIMASRSRRTG